MTDSAQPQPPYPPPVPPPPPAGAPSKKEGSRKYILLGIGGCLVFLLFAAGVSFFVYYIFRQTAEPVKVVNDHLDALRHGDVQKAYELCSGAFRENTSLDQFVAFVQNYPILKKADKFTSNNREVSSGVAKLTGSIHGTDGSNQPAEYHLVQEMKIWRIQQILIRYSGIVESDENTATPPPQSPQVTQPETPSQLTITEIQTQPNPGSNVTTVTLQFKVLGFANDKTGGTARVHLVQDLKTFDPAGNVLPDLSKDGIKELQESGQYQDYDFATFSNTLTIPNSYPRGRYTLQLMVHDRIGDTSTETTTEFVLE